jgi:hypothetical protein
METTDAGKSSRYLLSANGAISNFEMNAAPLALDGTSNSE